MCQCGDDKIELGSIVGVDAGAYIKADATRVQKPLDLALPRLQAVGV